MPRWQRGEAEVLDLIALRDLEVVPGASAASGTLLTRAGTIVTTAASLVGIDNHSAYVLAYDAARFACNSLLARQGLRATTSGGHYAVERAVRAQFGDGFRPFGDLRRRRNELEYPRLPGDIPTGEEAQEGVDDAQRIVAGAGRLIDELSLFA